MAENASEITVAQSGTVYVGPVIEDGEAPATLGDYTEVGYTTEDGVTFSAGADVTDINAWQSSTPVRRIVTSRSSTVGLSLQQWNADNFALAFGGGEWSESGGTYRYDPPADTDALSEYGVIVQFEDGDKEGSVYVFRATVDGAVETQLTRTGAAVLPITFTALTPDGLDRSWAFETADASFAASS